MSILKVSGVQKVYTTRFGGNKVEALKNVSFEVEPGEYVAIMNSDDVWEPDKLEKQMKALENNPDAIGCFTWCNMIGRDGEALEVPNPFHVSNRNKEEWMNYFYFHGNCMAHPSLLMKAEVYYSYRNCFSGMFRQIPDFYLWIQIVQEYEIIMLEETLTHIRVVNDEFRKNVSSLSSENLIRHFNEESYVWYKVITNMNNEFFLKAFKENLINVNAKTEQEIICEKFFVLLRAKIEYCKIAAFFYYYDNCLLMKEELERTYEFTSKDFYQLVSGAGPAKHLLAR